MAVSDPDIMAAIAVTRFGLGARPGELAAARRDAKAWLKAQVSTTGADQPDGPLPDCAARIATYRAFAQEKRMARKDVAADGAAPQPKMQTMTAAQASGVQDEMLARAQLAANTTAPFRERWALFWANHFTVSAIKAQTAPTAGPFEREAIRPHIFGRFEDMLAASSTHPGMLLYLDQSQSVGPTSPLGKRARKRQAGLNENLAREIMELHSVGVGAGYSQADVTEFARAMTGYSVGDGRFIFRPAAHEPGVRIVMGKTYPNNGEDQARAVMRDLAAHPATARHIARKLAVHFVADDPPPTLVKTLETAFTSSGGRLDVVANALIDAPESWAPAPAKFKTPYELVISGHRALGVAPLRAQQIAAPMNQLGQRPFGAPSPKGWPEEAAAWAAPDAVIKRLVWSEDFARAVSNGPRPPAQVAADCLGGRLATETAAAIAGAESRSEALTILFMSPEFQRR